MASSSSGWCKKLMTKQKAWGLAQAKGSSKRFARDGWDDVVVTRSVLRPREVQQEVRSSGVLIRGGKVIGAA